MRQGAKPGPPAAQLGPAVEAQPDQLVGAVERAPDDRGPRRNRRAAPRSGSSTGRARSGSAIITDSGRTSTSTAPSPTPSIGERAELARHHPACRRAGHRLDLAEEVGDPPRRRVGVQRLGRPGLLHAAVAHDGDDVGQRQRLLLVVGDEQGAGAGGAQDGAHLFAQRGAQRGVEGGERLVEQHHIGVGGQRPGERDPLALAAGQLVGVRAGAIGEADQFEALADTLTVRLPEPDVAHHAEVREQGAVLEHHADPAPFRLLPAARAGDQAATDLDRARVGDLEAGDRAQERRLAGAARAEQGDELAPLDDDGRGIDRHGVAESLGDVNGADRRGLDHETHGSGSTLHL